MSTTVLGVSAFYHDSAASLVIDGHVVAAAQQERFSRRRHDSGFPGDAVGYCLSEASIEMSDVDEVAYYEDPRLKFDRVLASAAAAGGRGSASYAPALTDWLRTKRRMDREVARRLRDLGDGPGRRVRTFPHHMTHAASAFLPSPFESAAVLCVDSVGEWATTTIWHGRDGRVEPVAEISFPHSLGLLYSAFTYFCGFKVDSGEYKLMGLAPYGRPVYKDVILRELVDVKDDGSFRLDWRKFEFVHGEVMTGAAFERLFGGPRRVSEGTLTEREFDLAASVQAVIEEVVLRLARTARELTGERNLCLAGGVALNCVANGVVSSSKVFEQIWVQPAAGDAGGSLGAALLRSHEVSPRLSRPSLGQTVDAMSGALLGPSYDDEEIAAALTRCGAVMDRVEPAQIDAWVARDLADGQVVGWFQGRMEFGPRALGARSILGDARRDDTQSKMNLRIKFRESFRPFAPSVLAAEASKYFDLEDESPYMLVVAPVAEGRRRAVPDDATDLRGIDLLKVPRSDIPAVTHVDFSARVQTVDPQRSPRYHALIEEFYRQTGCPLIVNTSFNVRGEPIVNTPDDAYRCFMRTNIDVLAIGSYYLRKSDQPAWTEETDWRSEIPLD